LQLGAIGLEGARVLVEVLAGAELQAIDENAGDHGPAVLAGLGHEGNVALVQVAHGGHEHHLGFAGKGGAQVVDPGKDLHGCFS